MARVPEEDGPPTALIAFWIAAVSSVVPSPLADVAVGIKVTDTLIQTTAQGFTFKNVGVAVDATSGGLGHLSFLDITATNTPILITAATSTTTAGSLLLENVIVDAATTAVKIPKYLSSC